MLNEVTIYLICSFAIGSIPFGWIIARLWGVADIRKEGSTNVGATNVVRTAGVVPGALTFLLDFAKGIVPMIYLPDPVIWYGLAAVLGHCFSPFLSFRGGKGVSTTLGTLVAFNPWLGGASILIYGVTLGVTRVSAIGSLFAMLTAVCGALIFTSSDAAKLAITLMVLVVLSRHRDNWTKLLTPTLAILLAAVSALAWPAHRAQAALMDFRGKEVAVNTRPARIAALIPSLAEAVIDLGAGERLVAAPDYSRLPPTLKNVSKLGAYNSISAEVVYAAHPDLVIASMDGNEASLIAQLEKLGLKVITVNTQSLAEIVRSMEIVAAAIGDPTNARLLGLRKSLAVATRPQKPMHNVFVQIGWEPLVTISHATYIDELVRLAGGSNIFETAPTKYPRPNPEEVIALNPDVIIICRLTDTGDEADRARDFWLQFKKLKAVKSGRVHIMPVDWLTKPGFNLMEGMRELRRIL
ncbi:MAG: glycerol-3-phosphate acyltransferase [Deltaproteobacteria bacterium]|nr:glycerol-3-phosphate acyltransferase [Deltaproteobacteria bacterium]